MGKVEYMRMGLAEKNSSTSQASKSEGKLPKASDLMPTWKVEKGVCNESLALAVLRDTGVS